MPVGEQGASSGIVAGWAHRHGEERSGAAGAARRGGRQRMAHALRRAAQRRASARRDLVLCRLGYRVLRLPAEQVQHRMAEAVVAVRAALGV